jgi:hypothetical protein
MPCDAVARAQMAQMKSRWGVYAPVIDDLKVKAKKLGLWNMFLSKTHYKEGAALTNLEYALVAGILGKSGLASSVRSPLISAGMSSASCSISSVSNITQGCKLFRPGYGKHGGFGKIRERRT